MRPRRATIYLTKNFDLKSYSGRDFQIESCNNTTVKTIEKSKGERSCNGGKYDKLKNQILYNKRK